MLIHTLNANSYINLLCNSRTCLFLPHKIAMLPAAGDPFYQLLPGDVSDEEDLITGAAAMGMKPSATPSPDRYVARYRYLLKVAYEKDSGSKLASSLLASAPDPLDFNPMHLRREAIDGEASGLNQHQIDFLKEAAGALDLWHVAVHNIIDRGLDQMKTFASVKTSIENAVDALADVYRNPYTPAIMRDCLTVAQGLLPALYQDPVSSRPNTDVPMSSLQDNRERMADDDWVEDRMHHFKNRRSERLKSANDDDDAIADQMLQRFKKVADSIGQKSAPVPVASSTPLWNASSASTVLPRGNGPGPLGGFSTPAPLTRPDIPAAALSATTAPVFIDKGADNWLGQFRPDVPSTRPRPDTSMDEDLARALQASDATQGIPRRVAFPKGSAKPPGKPKRGY